MSLAYLPACASSDGAADTQPAEADATADAALDAPPDNALDAAPDVTPADAALWESGTVAVVEQPSSDWHVALEGSDVVARHQGVDLALLIDPTNGATDGRYAGVYVTSKGVPRFDGTYNDSYCSMFVPDRPFINQDAVAVVADGATLTVTMTEGSLSEMSDSQFPSDKPFRWESAWSVETAGLRVVSSGLYYLLPSKDACDLTFLGENGVNLGSVQLTNDTSPFLRYFEGVRAIAVVSGPAGSFSIATDAQIVQVEVPSYPNTGLFELDFDHSFKERGQDDVHTELVLPIDG